MSDTEKDKDVSCFTADGVVAEMVIEVEENQKIGSDDLCNSPSKDNHCDKENDLVNKSKDSYDDIVEEEEENQNIESDSEKENKEKSIESIETTDNNEECMQIEDKTSEENNKDIVEDDQCEGKEDPIVENDPVVEDEIIQNAEDKKSEVNDSSIEDNISEVEQTVDSKPSEINQTVDNKFSEKENHKSDDIKQTVNKSGEIKQKNNKSSETKQKIDNCSEIKQKNINSNQNLKKKRKRESTMDENDIKETDMPRYPGIVSKLFCLKVKNILVFTLTFLEITNVFSLIYHNFQSFITLQYFFVRLIFILSSIFLTIKNKSLNLPLK